jgi:hypothetical protein
VAKETNESQFEAYKNIRTHTEDKDLEENTAVFYII